jgi:2-polyprenyl-3-methyl-5-hydroxy-6-metoxy-1,4-benzoquinol methylase
MRKLNDPEVVRLEYETEAGLAARRAAYADAEGPDAPGMVFDAVAEVSPKRVLEVGCGMGQLAQRLHEELDAEVVAIDQSERMVELTRERGVDARVADVQELPFGDGEFDVVTSSFCAIFAPDHQKVADELLRVCRPGGTIGLPTFTPEGSPGSSSRRSRAMRRRPRPERSRRSSGGTRSTCESCSASGSNRSS